MLLRRFFRPGALLLLAVASHAAEILHPDGRREKIADPRRGTNGEWTAEIEGKRVRLKPGEVVAVIDDEGSETVLLPTLSEAPAGPQTAALLTSLADPKNAQWLVAAELLSERPSRGVLDALLTLAVDKKKQLRLRAIHAMARLRTKESVRAAAEAILEEKDAGLRREAASALFSVQEILRRCEAAELLAAGLTDRDSGVRIVFALLAPADMEAATTVLRVDGLRSADHHTREDAALALGRRGDGSGASILIGMLARSSLPGFDGDKALMERFLVAEQVEVCALLGKLGTPAAKAALEKARSSRFEAVRAAAASALAPPS